MNEALAQILAALEPILFGGLAVFLRVGATMAVLPVFGEQGIPLRIRLAIALVLTVLVAPPALETMGPLLGDGFPARLFLTETVIGLAFGLMLRMFVFILQVAGEVSALSSSLSQIFGGSQTVDPQPAMGNLLLFGGLGLAALSGLHVKTVAAFVSSYHMLPAGVLPGASELAEWGVARASRAFGLAFSMAAPFMIGSLLYNLALGIINRAMPQLMVALVGAPAISGGGLFILALAAGPILALWLAEFDAFLADPRGQP